MLLTQREPLPVNAAKGESGDVMAHTPYPIRTTILERCKLNAVKHLECVHVKRGGRENNVVFLRMERDDDPSLAQGPARSPSSGEIRVCMQLHNGGRKEWRRRRRRTTAWQKVG